MTENRVRWGVMGPGSIARNVADALMAVPEAQLAAVASTDEGRRTAFADRYGIERRHATYEALAADPGVDALYVSTRNPSHAELSMLGLRHGKAVLCEKPAGLTAAEVEAVTEVARQEGRFWAEAFMYRCHPQIARVLDLIREGAIGEVVEVRSAFGWGSRVDPASRIHDPGQGGGAILDVGTYPVSLARLVAGAAAGLPFQDPDKVAGTGKLYAEDGVDAEAHAVLRFPSGVIAIVACSVMRGLDNSATITGTAGSLHIDDPWVPGRNAPPSDATIRLRRGGEESVEVLRCPEQLFVFEARMATRAVASGALEAPHPAASHADSLGNACALDRWREAVGYKVASERRGLNRPLPRVLRPGLPPVPTVTVPGLDRPVSQLVLGCDNRDTLAEGAIVWDAWWEAGGRAFDTAFVYGGGRNEAVLGEWLGARGVGGEATVIVKGAHSPYCLPGAIEPQMDLSLGRLGLDRAPIYVMHRDNPAVPVGEFVDVLDDLVRRGKVGAWGGSNWTPERVREAIGYAQARGKAPPRILNNNLSLAVMEKPVWAGCLHSHEPATLAWLRGAGVAHLSWSSQARGYFLPAELRDRLPADTSPETCFGSAANAERRRRAEALASRKGTTANGVALAWVLSQPFPSLALIGPRSAGELSSTLSALGVTLSESERAWLDLEREAP